MAQQARVYAGWPLREVVDVFLCFCSQVRRAAVDFMIDMLHVTHVHRNLCLLPPFPRPPHFTIQGLVGVRASCAEARSSESFNASAGLHKGATLSRRTDPRGAYRQTESDGAIGKFFNRRVFSCGQKRFSQLNHAGALCDLTNVALTYRTVVSRFFSTHERKVLNVL